MSDAYRNEHEAALRQLDALRRENDELRARLREGTAVPEPTPIRAGPVGLLLIAGVFFLAGSVTIAGAQRARCTRMVRGATTSPCPYLLARSHEGAPEGVLSRGERLLRAEPGVIRVELQGPHAPPHAEVRVDGMPLPRSGSIALSGPLAGGALHVVDVQAAGYSPLRTRVWVASGRTEFVRVALSPDPLSPDTDAPLEEPR
jgi:hypothetical protein